MKKFLLFRVYFIQIIFYFVGLVAFSQNNIYLPKDTDSLFNYLNKSNDFEISQLNDEFKSQKRKILEKRLEFLIEEINDSNYVFANELTAKFNIILENIYLGNPDLRKHHFYFLFDRSFIPNAAAYGDGIFVVNLGLFDFLESDDEIAFVICHEIAHYLNNDFKHQLDQYVYSLYSDETRNKVKEIKSLKYGQSNAGLKLVKELKYDLYGYSREKELIADKLGYLLLKNTNYNPKLSIETLNKLGKLEEVIFDESTSLTKVFDFAEYPFKQSWVHKEKSLFEVDEVIDDYKLDKDSLRTHPYAKERVEKLMDFYHIDTTQIAGNNEVLEDLKIKSKQYLVQSLMDHKNYDILLYILLRNSDISNFEMHADEIGKSLIAIYKSKKNHNLGKGVPQINPFLKEENLNQIRLFISQTEMFEIAKIGYLFAENNKKHLSEGTYLEMNDLFKR